LPADGAGLRLRRSRRRRARPSSFTSRRRKGRRGACRAECRAAFYSPCLGGVSRQRVRSMIRPTERRHWIISKGLSLGAAVVGLASERFAHRARRCRDHGLARLMLQVADRLNFPSRPPASEVLRQRGDSLADVLLNAHNDTVRPIIGAPKQCHNVGFDAQSCSEGPFEQSRSSSAGKAGLRRDLRLLETRRTTEHLRKLQSRMVFEKRDAPFCHVQATEPPDPLENGRLRERSTPSDDRPFSIYAQAVSTDGCQDGPSRHDCAWNPGFGDQWNRELS
jgi:hypothetical protein